jgi:hypothetical protein
MKWLWGDCLRRFPMRLLPIALPVPNFGIQYSPISLANFLVASVFTIVSFKMSFRNFE